MPESLDQTNKPKLEPTTRIKAALATCLNLADFQNSVPLIRDLCICNDLETQLTDLVLSVRSEPSFHHPKMWRVDALGAEQQVRISDLDLQLDGALFLRLTEAEKATVKFTLTAKGNEEPLAELRTTVELLPRNQWGGDGHLPDLLAAFVQPNDPAVERVLKQAAHILESNNKKSGLDGYSGGPKRAWELTSAIWNAIASMRLNYIVPPASFEIAGQKVRSPSHVAGSGLATCLDLSLFYCAACEQAGLHPVLVLTKGHAFAGVWLREEVFTTTVVDDITALRKRVKLNDLLLFETTLLTHRPVPSFTFATEQGAQHLSEPNQQAFQFAVDVHRARLHRIKPLASAEAAVYEQPEAVATEEPTLDEAPDLPEEPGGNEEVPPAELDPKDRLIRWQRKLLDLSLRNNLLNFKEGKKSLRLEVPDPAVLEGLLVAGESFKLMTMPELMTGADPRSQVIHEGREHEDLHKEVTKEALERKEILVKMPQSEMEGRLVEQFRTARSSLQEGGANTLFLAMGFLSWTQTDKPKPLRAPLILVPVTLNRRSVRSGFTISLHEDEPRFNPTLIEMLRQDFGLNLGISDGELSKDESGVDIAGIWRTVSKAIKDIKGWEVREEVILGMFSFAKHLMWKDLTDQIEKLRENPVVKHLIDTPRETYPSKVAFPDPRSLDRDFRPEQTFCPIHADSSQLSAVLAASRGKDFVLIGPPGTGKSQTIVNLIAQCLAEDKKVLFVSEKIAALNVVHRRLREVGLGEFCLEIHSSKAHKVDIIQKLETAWQARGTVDEAVWKAEAERLRIMREHLNTYVERMHVMYPNGWNIYRAIAQIVGGESLPRIALAWPTPNAHGQGELDALREQVSRLAVNAQAIGQTSLRQHPLAIIQCFEWSPLWQQRLTAASNRIYQNCLLGDAAFQAFTSAFALPPFRLTGTVRAGMSILINALPEAYGRDWRFALLPGAKKIASQLVQGLDLLAQQQALTQSLSPGWDEKNVRDCEHGLSLLAQRKNLLENLGPSYSPEVLENLKKGMSLLDSAAQAVSTLSVTYSENVDHLDVYQLQRDWSKAESSIWPLSWLRKRRVRQTLETVTQGLGVLDATKDVHTLAKIRSLHGKMAELFIGPATDGVWSGRSSKPENIRALIAFQGALASVNQGLTWEDKVLDRIAEGYCGERPQLQLAAMRKVLGLEGAIAQLQPLEQTTEGLWKGLETNEEHMKAALQFLAAMGGIRESGALSGDHPLVDQKNCGETLARDYRTLCNRSLVENQIAGSSDLAAATNGLWAGLKTDAAEVRRAVAFIDSASNAIPAIASASEEGRLLLEALDQLLGPSNHMLNPAGQAMETARDCLEALSTIQPSLDEFVQIGQVQPATTAALEALPAADIAQKCQAIAQQENRLRAWCAWQKAKQQSVPMGLGPLVETLEQGLCVPGNLRETFETNYCHWWVSAIVDQEDVVRTFVSAEHEKRISDFRALDDRFTKLTRDWVRARLCSGIPHPDAIPKDSDWGVLRHEISKRKRHMPVRILLRDARQAVTHLAPCLLMSPLSIAQYLPADSTAFNLVVFDEASQIPIWDAIGAIARGKQVVMVGDPKQLPPTNFFNRADMDSDDEDTEGDLESILDECLGANLPSLNLNWHYRSRNESLIAFSNHHYYGGGLVTFPSPATRDNAVSYNLVNGVYEKGGARINKVEAQAVVADVVRELRTKSGHTVGIVTFNTEQQSLIENLLDEERRNHPWIEAYFSDSELEPVFIKNLESVQGDERDIIYFSTTFGPDHSGVVSMNFGPMNQSGGERRLNVAITRARRALRVFTSLKPEQIDLSRTAAVGVRDLKYFLDFAARGQRALGEENRVGTGCYDSPFEEAVANALRRKGWVVQTQVGVSAYRIDLGVVHPDAPGIYLAGVECDGATYHHSATARDRDKSREMVLRGLGWEIVRVWSTDWWVDPSTTLEALQQRLEDLLAASRAKRMEIQTTDLSDPGGKGEAPEGSTPEEISDTELVTDTLYAGNQDEALPPGGNGSLDPDQFFEPSYDQVLHQVVGNLIDAEGPIHEERLARKVARMHGWIRTGGRIQARVNSVASRGHGVTREDVGMFFWPKSLAEAEVIPKRKDLSSLDRAVDEISMPELASLCRAYLGLGIQGPTAITMIARELGLARLQGASRERLEGAMRRALGQ